MSKRKRILAIICCLVLGAADLAYLNLQLVPLLGPKSPASTNQAMESAAAEAPAPVTYKVNRSISRPASHADSPGTPEDSASRPEPAARKQARQERPSPPVEKKPSEKPFKAEDRIKEQARPRLLTAVVLHFEPSKFHLNDSQKEKLHDLIAGVHNTSDQDINDQDINDQDTGDLWIQVEGHADQTGQSDTDNLQLSELRANAAASFLLEQGIAKAQVEVRALGSSKPVDKTNKPDAWAKNRRAVIRVFKGKP